MVCPLRVLLVDTFLFSSMSAESGALFAVDNAS